VFRDSDTLSIDADDTNVGALGDEGSGVRALGEREEWGSFSAFVGVVGAVIVGDGAGLGTTTFSFPSTSTPFSLSYV